MSKSRPFRPNAPSPRTQTSCDPNPAAPTPTAYPGPTPRAPERARVEPVPGAVDAEHARDGRDDVAAVADDDGTRVEDLVERGGEAVVVDGRRLGLELVAVLVPPGGVRCAQALEPRLAPVARRLDHVREDAEDGATVTHDRGVGEPVPPELAGIGVDVDELRRAEPTEPEAEVERRADHAHDVRLVERDAAGVPTEELVPGRQRPSPGAVQERRQPAVLGERRQLTVRAVPPDPASRHDGRPFRRAQEVGGFMSSRGSPKARGDGREEAGARCGVWPPRRGGRRATRGRRAHAGGASACRKATATYSGIRLAEGQVAAHFVSGFSRDSWSSSWSAPHSA